MMTFPHWRKFINQLAYLSRNISSTESDVNICIGKAWTAIDRLARICKPDLSHKICGFFQPVAMSVLVCDCTSWTLTKGLATKLHWGPKDTAFCFEQTLEAALYKTAAVWPLVSHLTNHISKMSKTLLEK